MNKKKTTPPLLLSLVPIAVLVTLLFFSIRIFGSDALNGASQLVLLISTAVCSFIATTVCKVKWADIEKAMVSNIAGVSPALLILLCIGALAGTWMISGIVPTLIYYGVQIISPAFFLCSACIICSVISVMTGSSWTTIATIGIALIGIGEAQGFDPGWVAGAIISGAYFGDKISPLSDTTVMASSVTGTHLFTHIRYMLITTVPAILISLGIFTVAGLSLNANDTEQIAATAEALQNTFHISPWLMITPIVTAILIIRKVPSIITLFTSAILAGIFAIIFQPHLLQEISGTEHQGFSSAFKGVMATIFGSTHIKTGNSLLNDLTATRGMAGMLNTIWLILCAMCFGGAMAASGMLRSITHMFLHFMTNRVSLVSGTVVSGLFFNICTADQYISIILTGNMFKDVYTRKGYESRLLSRTTEDSVSVTSVLIPWNSCGMTQASVLGVATLTYFPYCFFNLLSPLMSILVAAIGYKIFRISPEKKGQNNSLKPEKGY